MDSPAQLSTATAPGASPFPPPSPLFADLPQGTRLHVGGQVRAPGWTVLNIVPGPHVDIVGDCSDLSRVADQSCAIVYASHVVEHLGYNDALPKTMKEFNRVLAPGGQIMISVPDLDMLCRLFTLPELTGDERFFIMRMMFGGRMDAHDVHLVGLNAEFLAGYLSAAGFVDLRRVQSFGLFQDTSSMQFKGCPVSVNVTGRKPS
jgi:predicted SAM-dependent methyltransferase